jgi:hypothetical protein
MSFWRILFIIPVALSGVAVSGAQAHTSERGDESFLSQARAFLAGSESSVHGSRCFASFTVSDQGLTLQMKSRDGVGLVLTLDENDLINGAPISAHSTVRPDQLVFMFGENGGGVFAIEKKNGQITDVTVAFEDEERDLSCSISDSIYSNEELMKKSILVLASALAVQSQASAYAVVNDGNPDAMQLTLRCSDPELVDAGLIVDVSYGGLQPHYSAEVSESRITGKKVILTVPSVTLTTQGISQIFTDTETQGESFRLVYRPEVVTEDSSESMNATLTLTTDTGTTSSDLTCHSISHPM